MTKTTRFSARLAVAVVGVSMATVGVAASAEAATYHLSPRYSGYKSCEVARTSPAYNNGFVKVSGNCLRYEHPVTREFTGYRFVYATP